MYKDKDKQREANRAIQAKRRAKGVTQSGCDTKGVTCGDDGFITQEFSNGIKITQPCPKCRPEHHPNITKPERTAQGNIRVSKPGDSDYEPQCETTGQFQQLKDGSLVGDGYVPTQVQE